jgi:hypothetical protein
MKADAHCIPGSFFKLKLKYFDILHLPQSARAVNHLALYFRRDISQYSKNPPFCSHPMPATRRVRPVSARMTAHASRHAVVLLVAAARPPGWEARICEGRNDGEDGDADGCSVRTAAERGRGSVHAMPNRWVSGVGNGQGAAGRKAVGLAWLFVS